MLGMTIPTSIAVMAMGSGVAWAQSTVWNIEGSDTLTGVIKEAITLSGARLQYGNPGSGQAEKDMQGIGNYLESIGPMSRNFTYGIVDPLTGSHPTWQPKSPEQVLCLDAAILTSRKAQMNPTVTPPNGTNPVAISDLAIVLGGYPKGCWGSAPAACNILYGAVLNPPVSNVNMSGGTTPECAHPERYNALQRLTSMAKVIRIDHILRRDDKSGTQDTFREWIQFTNWCNGKSEGNTNAIGSNMKNEDLDPIRRPCMDSDWTLQDPKSPYNATTNPYVSGTKQVTKCSYYPLAKTCNANDPDIGPGTAGGDYTSPDPSDQTKTVTNRYGVIRCSQGLVVALSESDAFDNSVDITQSIGQRVAGQVNGYYLGLAGLASNVNGTFAGKINGNLANFSNVHKQTYLLSRRLFLQRGLDIQSSTGYDSDRAAQENQLYTWATNKCNITPLCVKYGFMATMQDKCSDNCQSSKEVTPINVGGCGNADPGAGTPKQCIGAEGEAAVPTDHSKNTYPAVADGNIPADGAYCPLLPALTTGYYCNVANASVSGPDKTDYPPNGGEGLGAEPSVKCGTGRCNIDGTLLVGVCCDPALTPPAVGACPQPLLP